MRAVRQRVLALVAVALVAGCSSDPGAAVTPPPPATATAESRAAATHHPEVDRSQPTARAQPRYLERRFQVPPSTERSARARRAGTLRIPSLRISAPVLAVGLDRGTMAIPDSPSRIGWLRSTAAVGDRIGASVLSGHVSDRRDVPGALHRLRAIRRGAEIRWTGVRGEVHRFVVTAIKRYPRGRGLPARLFKVVGPHVLHLVTCADQVRTAGGGFHYTANLVVTAREVRHPSD